MCTDFGGQHDCDGAGGGEARQHRGGEDSGLQAVGPPQQRQHSRGLSWRRPRHCGLQRKVRMCTVVVVVVVVAAAPWRALYMIVCCRALISTILNSIFLFCMESLELRWLLL